jgi:succinate dehydrogenase / fumarate reductase flavoprotein subunit
MYHQFKQLANLDITKEPMEVGPTTHYVMGGVWVDADTQMSTVPGLFAAGEVGAGLHGANRLGGNSLSDLLVFGKRAGEYAAKFAQENGVGKIDGTEVDALAKAALEPLERDGDGENPYEIQRELQEMMQDKVGIIREDGLMKEAIDDIAKLGARATKAAACGNREYNPGWHTALDLKCLLTVSEASARAALERQESRGAQTRNDFPDKDPDVWGKHNLLVRKGGDGQMEVEKMPVVPQTDEQKQIIEDNQ